MPPINIHNFLHVYVCSVDVPRGRRSVRGVGGRQRRARLVRASRRRASLGPKSARRAAQGTRAPRADQMRCAVAA